MRSARDAESPVRHLSRANSAPHAALCCPDFALAALTAAELAALDRFCRRALDDPDAEPFGPEEIAAAERYEAVLRTLGATVYPGASRGRWAATG